MAEHSRSNAGHNSWTAARTHTQTTHTRKMTKTGSHVGVEPAIRAGLERSDYSCTLTDVFHRHVKNEPSLRSGEEAAGWSAAPNAVEELRTFSLLFR